MTIVHHRCAESIWNLRPGQSLCEGAPQQPLQPSSQICIIKRTLIIMISDTQDNSNGNFNMETEKSLPTKRKEKSDGFTTPPSKKISKFNDIQPNFQIDLANKFNVLSHY
ncbi:hypothetical protein TNIN_440951 [Trichonephila inaurata madagascariensis]|uniref:Uncharacterized protein n=1 Tax=Trichonephila inaurata madagascariensis TaxID=2747483 RepID=A0A8X7BYX6_9ARAC|nr:hypothetical protein TNIN_440951 [Trichonephila inaurata madagascariensis]